MHSKGMYLGLQGTRILLGFLTVSAVARQKACIQTIGANDSRAGEGLTWRRQQIDCTRLQLRVRARATSSMVVVFTRRACGPRCNIWDSSRAIETSRHAAQQTSTLMKCKAAVVIQASAGRCVAGPWIWANIVSPLFVMVHWTWQTFFLGFRDHAAICFCNFSWTSITSSSFENDWFCLNWPDNLAKRVLGSSLLIWFIDAWVKMKLDSLEYELRRSHYMAYSSAHKRSSWVKWSEQGRVRPWLTFHWFTSSDLSIALIENDEIGFK